MSTEKTRSATEQGYFAVLLEPVDVVGLLVLLVDLLPLDLQLVALLFLVGYDSLHD